jgi:tRNA threonylcarbamoyladenosine biosynthesis protein TsaE
MLLGVGLVKLRELPECAGNALAAIWMLGQKERATVVALVGELGSGKTTFVQAMLKRLGIAQRVQSPTYVLMKRYPLEGALTTFGSPRRFNRVVHIDAYRLAGAKEFESLRPEEFLADPKALVLVEWPERAGEALPAADLTVKFSSEGAGPDERYIEIV